MTAAMRTAAEALVEWCDAHPASYPPTIIHVTDGASTDGDPSSVAEALKQTCHRRWRMLAIQSAYFYGRPTCSHTCCGLRLDAQAQLLFQLMQFRSIDSEAQKVGYQSVNCESRFFDIWPAAAAIVDFSDIGTRARHRDGMKCGFYIYAPVWTTDVLLLTETPLVAPSREVYAVSDGASESFASGRWALLLVSRYVRQPKIDAQTLGQAIATYNQAFDRQAMSWSAQASFDRSFATLLGIQFDKMACQFWG